MSTVTLELQDEHLEQLRTWAAELKMDLSELVGLLVEQYAARETAAYAPEQEAAIRAGLDDIAAGRVIAHEDVMRDADRIVNGS
jgi:predicted transcriptional regulator